jgi:hypothetical protein
MKGIVKQIGRDENQAQGYGNPFMFSKEELLWDFLLSGATSSRKEAVFGKQQSWRDYSRV